ncbi:MAG: hypothetical protein D6698_14335 [Gammaproteobacteria bacterium]|nr:MAG: hypothetical protein D6698_14335 [Gammaproteobacteria bacterium]
MSKVLNNALLAREKLASTLDKLRLKLSGRTSLREVLSESVAAFHDFYGAMGDPVFVAPAKLQDGDSPRSEVYNTNMLAIHEDIARFFKEVDNLAASQTAYFNIAKMSNDALVGQADRLASTVLDLKILNDLTRGDVLVASDDFRNLDRVDTKASTGAPKAEKLPGSGGVTLKRRANRDLTTLDPEIEVFPLAPVDSPKTKGLGLVNTEPTPGNLRRFYEGNYYNFIGRARPEGGKFNIRFILRPDTSKKKKVVNTKSGNTTNTVVDDSAQFENTNAGFFVEIGASEDEKKRARLKMLDQKPDTFWEAEYVYNVPKPLVSNIIDEGSVAADNNKDDEHKDNLPRTATLDIDLKEAERVAKSYDFEGRDLIVDLVITFRETITVNYVVIDPVIFGAESFPSVEGIWTSTDDEGQFRLVKGWNSTRYAKTLTPEANKFLNVNQVNQLLAPSRYEYTGKGVFPFPATQAKRVKIRLKIDNPVPAVYERYYTLLRNQVEVQQEVVTTTKRGLLRFCWIAQVVVPDEWRDVRNYIMRKWPIWAIRLYHRHGEKIAAFLAKHRWLIWLIRPYFRYMAKKGREIGEA